MAADCPRLAIEGPPRRGLDRPGGAKRSRPAGSGETGGGAGRLGTGPQERPGSQPPVEGRIGATRPLRCAGVTPKVDASCPAPERATRPAIYWMVRGAMPRSRGMRTGDFSLTGHSCQRQRGTDNREAPTRAWKRLARAADEGPSGPTDLRNQLHGVPRFRPAGNVRARHEPCQPWPKPRGS